MRKRFLTILLIMALANFFIATVAYAQDEVTDPAQATEVTDQVDEQTTEVAEEAPFAESPQMNGLEMFARKLFGSGLVDLFIQGICDVAHAAAPYLGYRYHYLETCIA